MSEPRHCDTRTGQAPRAYAVSIDVIKAGLIARLDVMVAELFPAARQVRGEWVMGDVHGAPGSSLSIRRHGPRAGWWKDFAGGAKGDVITLFAAGRCAGDLRAAIPEAVRYLGLEGLTPDQRREQERKAERAKARAVAKAESDDEALRRAARGHWHRGLPIAGTPADAYLLGRGIDIRRLMRPPGSLRFAAMRCPLTGLERACMIAIVNHPTTRVQLALHRTFLEVLPDGRVTKADDPRVPEARRLAKAKLALGPYAGGYIPLARGAGDGPDRILLSEGIEDGLSVALAMPGLKVGAALSLSNMGGVALPDGLGLTIAAQNDIAPTAVKALADARARLAARGIDARAVFPVGHKDWNDWLRALQEPGGGRVDVAMGQGREAVA